MTDLAIAITREPARCAWFPQIADTVAQAALRAMPRHLGVIAPYSGGGYGVRVYAEDGSLVGWLRNGADA